MLAEITIIRRQRAELETRVAALVAGLASASAEGSAAQRTAQERAALLERDLSEASGRLQQLVTERRGAQEALSALERERGGLGSRLQQARVNPNPRP